MVYYSTFKRNGRNQSIGSTIKLELFLVCSLHKSCVMIGIDKVYIFRII